MNTALINQIKAKFEQNHGIKPIMVFSPGRINLIGEHTDYNEGFVFPAAIDKGIIAAFEKADTDYCSIEAVDFKEQYQFLLNNIQAVQTGGWQNFILGVVAEIQKKGIALSPFNIVFGGDIPLGAGLSSSAALENSIVFGLNQLFNLGLSKLEMILISQKAEHHFVGVKCGIMDMYASMFGQNDHLLLLDCRTVESKAFQIDFEDYELILIKTNVKHSLADSAYNNRRMVCEDTAKTLGIKALRDANEFDLEKIKNTLSKEDFQKALYVIQEINRTQEAAKAIKKNDLKALGKLIFASHDGLQNQYKVSCNELDFLVQLAKENKHVLGARMMGGGFGGCTINIIAKSETEHFINEVSVKYKNAFKNDCSVYQVHLSQGTHLID